MFVHPLASLAPDQNDVMPAIGEYAGSRPSEAGLIAIHDHYPSAMEKGGGMKAKLSAGTLAMLGMLGTAACVGNIEVAGPGPGPGPGPGVGGGIAANASGGVG